MTQEDTLIPALAGNHGAVVVAHVADLKAVEKELMHQVELSIKKFNIEKRAILERFGNLHFQTVKQGDGQLLIIASTLTFFESMFLFLALQRFAHNVGKTVGMDINFKAETGEWVGEHHHPIHPLTESHKHEFGSHITITGPKGNVDWFDDFVNSFKKLSSVQAIENVVFATKSP